MSLLLTLCNIKSIYAFDLFNAWEAALSYSADYEAARYAKDAEKEQAIQARAALLPQISANLSYQHQPPTLSSTTDTNGWNIQANQTLFDKGRWAQYQQGKITSKMANRKLSKAEEELLLDVAKAYFQVLLDQDKLAAVEEEQKAYAQQIRQAMALFDKGLATIVDTHEAQAGYEAACAKKNSIITDLSVARNNLESLTGLNPDQIKPIKSTAIDHLLNTTQKNEWLKLANQYNSDWQLQKLAVEAAKQNTIAAKSGHWPKLTLMAGYQDNHNTQQYYGINQKYRSKGGTVTLQLNIPLYSGGMINSQVREAAAKEMQNKALLVSTQRKVKLAIDQAYQTVIGNEYQVQAQQQLLTASETKLKATRLGHQVGVRSNLDELQAQQAKTDAEQQLAQARYNYITAYLQLLQSSGILTNKVQQQRLQQLLY
ncbi:TolC family outer membrane protein [Neisseriaceae bacterium ESL0693]|nr:TolC family outer membrane protein [Neisseriaceae bacterium ESL0693]